MNKITLSKTVSNKFPKIKSVCDLHELEGTLWKDPDGDIQMFAQVSADEFAMIALRYGNRNLGNIRFEHWDLFQDKLEPYTRYFGSITINQE